MTQDEIAELEVLFETKLKGCYETYRGHSAAIQEELEIADANQAECDAETAIIYQTQDEGLSARTIVQRKRQ
jgi:hypothetical protein